jgi:hypothetical protein
VPGEKYEGVEVIDNGIHLNLSKAPTSCCAPEYCVSYEKLNLEARP